MFRTEADLIAVACQLGADAIQPWSPAERALVAANARGATLTARRVNGIPDGIRAGVDPLGPDGG